MAHATSGMRGAASLPSDVREALSLLRKGQETSSPRLADLRWLARYARAHLRRAAAAACCMAVVAGAGAVSPVLMMTVIDRILPARSLPLFDLLVAGLIALQLLRPAFSFLAGYHFVVLGQSVQAAVREDLFRRLVRLPLAFFEQRQSGYLVARLAEVNAISALFSQAMLTPVLGLLEFVFSLSMMLYISWPLTVVSTLLLPVFYLVARFQGRGFRTAARSLMEQGAQVSQRFQESLSGMQAIKEFGAEERESRRVADALRQLLRKGIVQSIIQALAIESVTTAVGVMGLVVLWVSGRGIMADRFTIGAYVAFTAYLVKFLVPVQAVAVMSISLQTAFVGVRRLSELMQQMTEDADPRRVESLAAVRGHIVIDDVHFRYDGNDGSEALAGVTAEILPGECVAIVGPSGSGKTTLVKLLLGLYPVSGGAIRIDGHDIRSVDLRDLRDAVGIVSQNVFLFNDTVRHNILYSRPEADHAQMIAAAKAADAHGFITALPQGYDTVIGERGARLSGGQTQRVSIARALLRDPAIVVFDEATSQLDGESEQRVWKEAERRLGGKTRIVISHRLTPVVRADRVIVLEHGRVLACGRHADLLANEPRYRWMFGAAAEAV